MGKPSIPRGSDYMFNAIWEGNGGGQRVGKFVPYTDNGTITNSCIFNAGDSPKLTYSPSGSGDKQKFSFSCWYKPVNTGTRRVLYAVYHGNNSRYANIQVDDNEIKHNKYIPETNIQIKSKDDINVDGYEYILVLAWNFFESIVKNNKTRFKKSKFIKLK